MIPDAKPKPPDPFALFVRAKEGHIVTRFGHRSAIGYRFTPDTQTAPAQHEWDTETIHAITAEEYAAHRREYDAELGEGGGLAASTREDWERQRDARRKVHDALKDRRKAEAEKEKAPITTKQPPVAPAGTG